MSSDYTELAPGFTGRVIGSKTMQYASAIRALHPGERLYAVHDQVVHTTVVHLPDEAAWLNSDEKYGMGLSINYFLAASDQPPTRILLI